MFTQLAPSPFARQHLAGRYHTRPARPAGAAGPYDGLLYEAACRHGVPFQILRRMAHTESTNNPYAVSPKGARGLMQLMPATARQLGVTNPNDPRQSAMGAARYLRTLIDEFGDLRLAVAAYNAGPGNVRRYRGIPPFAETRNYVRKVCG